MAYNLIVAVREVWDTRDLVGNVLDESGQIKDGALDTRFEQEDLNALEMALRIKDDNDATVTAISIGAPKNIDVLRESMYRGVDNVLRIDANPETIDAQTAAALIAAAVKDIGDYDLIITGSTVADAENSLLGAHIAQALNINSISWVDELEEITEDRITAKRAIEMGYEYIETPFPSVISVGVALLEDDPRTPRNAKAMLKLKKKKETIETKTPSDLDLDSINSTTTTKVADYEPVEQRVIESKVIDAEDEDALQSMLNETLKGE